jgi:hypothetical protein
MLTSKHGLAICDRRSSAVMAYCSAMLRAYCTADRCEIITPFGAPVEPEVYMT